VTTVVVTAMKSSPSVAAGKHVVVYFTTTGKGAAFGCIAGGNACAAN
jgi:altronate dehydratase